jgi:transcriptional regulator with XRE-family HTH domain
VIGRDYARALGDRLRAIRLQKGMSLHDVQESSEGIWKAAVIGAYERGDRMVTVAKLSELARFYGVPMSEILPPGPEASATPAARRRLILHLDRFDSLSSERREPLDRFTAAIQVQRGDFNGRVLTIREDDLLPLSLICETSEPELTRRLKEWGILTNGSP